MIFEQAGCSRLLTVAAHGVTSFQSLIFSPNDMSAVTLCERNDFIGQVFLKNIFLSAQPPGSAAAIRRPLEPVVG